MYTVDQQLTVLERRLPLHNKFKELTANVYYQPPSTLVMKYPCIVYNLDDDEVKYANNVSYNRRKRYQVTFISRDPDDPVPDQLVELPYCSFQRRFVTAELTHDVFNLFF